MSKHIDVMQSTGNSLRVQVRQNLSDPAGPFQLDVDLTIERGSFVLLVGPSGAGKTTLLKLIAGLSRPVDGTIYFAGDIWSDSTRRVFLPVRKRPIGFMFQDYALFPNMSVRGNLTYALGRHSVAKKADELLNMVGLQGLADEWPARLSGGQRQRLALIRALARRPSLLMLDEPLSALDPELREQLQDQLRALHQEFATTTVMISHDPTEILRLADRVIRLERGSIVCDGLPAATFRSDSPAKGLFLPVRYICGPDEQGMTEILHAGKSFRVACQPPPGCQQGDLIQLEARPEMLSL